MINVSETAAAKINELLTEENKAGSGLREQLCGTVDDSELYFSQPVA